MSGEQRIFLAFEMSLFARELAKEGVWQDHPECTEAQVARELFPATVAGRAAVSVPDVFRRIIAALNQSGIGYMLSGSFASAHYGVPRSTQDIELAIEALPQSCVRSSRRCRAKNSALT
jgi:hypothetical protein